MTLLAESREGLDRVKTIVLALKDFAHADKAELVPADLVAGQENTLQMAGVEIRHLNIVVKQHGGRLDVRAEAGHGASFTGWLPRRATAG